MSFCDIHKYAMEGDLAKLKEALEAERKERELSNIVELIDVRCDDGSTPLVLAASFGRFEVIQFLIDNGADLRAHRRDSDSIPLFIVIVNIGYMIRNKEGDVENFYKVAQLLLAKDITLLDVVNGTFTFSRKPIFTTILDSCPEERQRMLQIITDIAPNYPRLPELKQKVAEDVEKAQRQAVLAADEAVRDQSPSMTPLPQTKTESLLIPSLTTLPTHSGQQLTQRHTTTVTQQPPPKKTKQSVDQQPTASATYSEILNRVEAFSSRLFSFFTGARRYQAIPSNSSEDVAKKHHHKQ